ncbi:hypothetical protein [Campylobacter majalis]|uniref:hypothetical protein n=1 Tax=Campylobacter majalis TaxID=2790656 RepID=UPI003D69D0EF
MYANKINLIATNDGVGVNNKGIILVTNIKINANGDIINSGKIKSNATTKIKTDRFINKDNLQKTEINSYYAVLKANEIINYGIFNFKFLEVYSDKFINNSSNLNLANAVIYSNDFILKNAK